MKGNLDGVAYMRDNTGLLVAAPVISADHLYGPTAGTRIVAHDYPFPNIEPDQVVEFEFGSDALNEAIAHSKFKNTDWGKKARGHIALQDHHDEVYFRNLKIRELPAPDAK